MSVIFYPGPHRLMAQLRVDEPIELARSELTITEATINALTAEMTVGLWRTWIEKPMPIDEKIGEWERPSPSHDYKSPTVKAIEGAHEEMLRQPFNPDGPLKET
jgi:hypothetical protein